MFFFFFHEDSDGVTIHFSCLLYNRACWREHTRPGPGLAALVTCAGAFKKGLIIMLQLILDVYAYH